MEVMSFVKLEDDFAYIYAGFSVLVGRDILAVKVLGILQFGEITVAVASKNDVYVA